MTSLRFDDEGVIATQYNTAASLDGFIATGDDSLDWLFPLGNAGDTSDPDFIAGVGACMIARSARRPWARRLAQNALACHTA